MSQQFKNDHLSFSRISRYEQCPLSFKFHYIDKLLAESGVPLLFGKAIHSVFEHLVREHMEEERTGFLSESRASGLWQQAFSQEQLVGGDLFHEGMEIIKNFIRKEGIVNHQDILAVEKEFDFVCSDYHCTGFIDRVDCIDDETIEIRDYKTNRIIFTRNDVDTSLQMSIYQIAAKKIWPWAKKIKLTFDMLRHGIQISTERDQSQLDDAIKYIETVGQQTEQAKDYPPKLNTNCIYCDHSSRCPAYQDALEGKQDFVCQDSGDIEAVCREREELAKLVKILSSRKIELEKIIKG